MWEAYRKKGIDVEQHNKTCHVSVYEKRNFQMKGRVFDIQHFSTHDGPGIRTTVFLKGCPLHCSWCHNPESQHLNVEMLFQPVRCIGCGACADVCPGDDAHIILRSAAERQKHCKGCTLCAEKCPTMAIELCGREWDAASVFEEVMKDETYYRHSGGGVTLSGGEPMLQADFSQTLLKMLHESGVHTAIETSGCVPFGNYEAILPYTDLLIWDVKLMEKELYHLHTGGDLDAYMENLARIYRKKEVDFLFRFLFIPEIHLQPKILEATKQLYRFLSPCDMEIIPYHVLGNDKRTKLGLGEMRFREPVQEEIDRFLSAILS